MAVKIIDDAGQVDRSALHEAISALRGACYSLDREGHRDGVRNRHMLAVLRLLAGSGAAVELLEGISAPHDNGVAEELIRGALHLDVRTPVDAATARRAVLSAWLTYLRQNVGSCFATAPAILVQSEQPLQFLRDMSELVETGKLTRVVSGTEHTVPLSPSWGQGDLLRPFVLDASLAAQSPGLQAALGRSQLERRLNGFTGRLTCARDLIETLEPERRLEAQRAFKMLTDNALLKAWEFTLAAFSESKADVSRWNFYSALGLDPREPGGLGAVLYSQLQQKLDQVNRQVEELQFAYESAFAVVKTAESRLRRATADDASFLQADYRNKAAELDKLRQERDRVHARGQRMSGLAAEIVQLYNQKFREYFQEIYDAEMADVGPNPFDDAPAGFRLLYKHGRDNPALWTLVETPEQFVDALVDFFVSTEALLAADLEDLGRELADLVTALVSHARTQEFLESALYRTAKAHGGSLPAKPLEHLELVEKKPWAYVSGGTLEALVRNYYGRESGLTSRQRLIESPTDLFVFLLEAMKEQPARISNPFVESPDLSLLIQSPTHAFLFKPGYAPFREGWLDRGNSYTWVRDHVVRSQEDFLAEQWVEPQELGQLAKGLGFAGQRLPEERRRPRDVVSLLASGRQGADELVEAALYRSLPFLPGASLPERVEEVVSALAGKAPETSPPAVREPVAAWQFYQICLDMLRRMVGPQSADDLPGRLIRMLRRLGLAYPAPVLFADTNWTQERFGFLVGPGSGELELWRSDPIGLEAAPMRRWKNWTDGSSKIPWAIYPVHGEYTSLL